MNNLKDAENLKESLGKFLNSWREVSEYWSIYNNALDVSSYPFDESFDDIDIEQWIIDMCNEIDSGFILEPTERSSTHIVFLNGQYTNDDCSPSVFETKIIEASKSGSPFITIDEVSFSESQYWEHKHNQGTRKVMISSIKTFE